MFIIFSGCFLWEPTLVVVHKLRIIKGEDNNKILEGTLLLQCWFEARNLATTHKILDCLATSSNKIKLLWKYHLRDILWTEEKNKSNDINFVTICHLYCSLYLNCLTTLKSACRNTIFPHSFNCLSYRII